jgi:hypothetical protein
MKLLIATFYLKDPIEKNMLILTEFFNSSNIKVIKTVANRPIISCEIEIKKFKNIFKQNIIQEKMIVEPPKNFEKIIEDIKILKIY